MSLHEKNSSDLIGCFLTEGEAIDRAIQLGITPAHFPNVYERALFHFLCELRLSGKDTSPEGVFAAAGSEAGRLAALGGMGEVVRHQNLTTLHLPQLAASLIDAHGRREAFRLLTRATQSLADGSATLADVKELADQASSLCAGNVTVHRVIGDIAGEAIAQAEEEIAGKASSQTLVTTGLPNFDRYATPMGPEEFVIVGGRTSAGKSSLMMQIAGHNLAKGLRVAIFSLETSDSAVLKQIVGQRAKVNLRDLGREMPAKQQEYLEKLRHAKASKNLLIFDRDISLRAIQARCRLLATSFKPQLVVIDYLNIIGADGDAYEKTTRISNALIETRKNLGCTLMVGAQLNRSSEKEERQPTRTDLRDSGSCEQDCHRLLAIWRKPGQALDLNYYDSALLQLKNRSGPLALVDCRFHALTTTFMETANHA